MKKFGFLKFAIVAAGTYVAVNAIKQKIEEEKQREAEIEAEISAIMEQKFGETEEESEAEE